MIETFLIIKYNVRHITYNATFIKYNDQRIKRNGNYT